ncbi:uncharacterized protein LOC131679143 isoform X2 [Topomyia yanbarensis]|uniref:uncharacterized protein LOC131679143 isoform X2 n=1 Tax=Topomyia yanbarensis TaxID=2498891 RepID=UPI00273C86CE|nr:uncharacterized protein LOC131679143 isoform X2 [Topomyia yanbarensis]
MRLSDQHAALFGSITELNLELAMDQAVSLNAEHEYVLGQLRKFHYLQLYSGSAPACVAVRLSAPNLESAAIALESLTDEESLYREGPLLELKGCSWLKSLEVDLKGRMWENFFSIERPCLERLLLRRASDESEEYDWDKLFGNMPGLRDVEMVFSNDAMLTSLRRNCRKLEKLTLNGFRFEDGSFADNMNMISLTELHMDGRLRSVLYSKQSTLRLNNMNKLVWNYVKFSRVQYIFVIDAPRLASVTIRWCDYRRLQLRPGSHLESIDMDYYGNQTVTPNFFSASLDHLRCVTLYINSSSLILVGQMANFLCLKQLEIVCSTVNRSYDCSALFGSICLSCLGLEELTVRNEHENQLTVEYTHLTQLVHLTHLKQLTLQYITITNVSSEMKLAHRVRTNVKGCTAVDSSGMQTRFPIEMIID